MNSWSPTLLGELIEIKHGFAYKGEFFSDAPPGDVLVTPGNFAIGGGFRVGKPKFYSGPAVPDYVLSVGDLLVTMTDLSKSGDTLGYSALVPDDSVTYLHNQRIGKVELLTDEVSRDFLYWLMRTSAYREEVLASCTGSTVKHTSPKRIRAFKFLLPSRHEQDRICGVLNSLDEKIELNRRMNGTLEAMAQAIFRDWFVDFGPTRRKLGGATDPVLIMGGLVTDLERAQELADLFPVSLGDGGLPDDWEEQSLGAILEELETGSRPKGGIKGITEGVPSVGAESIDGIARFDFGKTKYVPDTFFSQMKKGKAKDRDVFLYKDGGRPGAFEPHVALFGETFPFERYAINEHVYRMRASAPYSQEYLYFHLSSERCMEEMRVKGTGVAIPGLNSSAVKSLRILRSDATAAFKTVAEPLVTKILLNAKQSQTLAAARDLLLPKLMSGEIRAGDAQDIVEAAE